MLGTPARPRQGRVLAILALLLVGDPQPRCLDSAAPGAFLRLHAWGRCLDATLSLSAAE